MARRALAFVVAHPDQSAGFTTATAQLAEALASAGALSDQQYNGIRGVRSATAEKMNLRRKIRSPQLEHLASVARLATREVPEIDRKFVLVRSGAPNLAFRTAARAMLTAGQAEKDVLLKHGLNESVFAGLQALLDQFDAATEKSDEARRSHVGASLALNGVGHELLQIVAVLDSMNRLRFEDNAEKLAEWKQASSVQSTSRTAPEVAREATPAAAAATPVT